MPTATKPVNTRTVPKTNRDAEIIERVNRRYNKPGLYEKGLEVLRQQGAIETLAKTKKDAPTPNKPVDEYSRLVAAKCLAEARLEVAEEERKAEADAAAERPKLEAARAFDQAYFDWLKARAGIEDPEATDETMSERIREESAAERRLFNTPPAHLDQVWQLLEAFEVFLGAELRSGERRDSILLLAFASIKQALHNLGELG